MSPRTSRGCPTAAQRLKECHFKIQLDDVKDDYNYDVRIERNANAIRGRLEFFNEHSDPHKELQFSELWIQLEGLVRTHFWTRDCFNCEEYLYLPDENEPMSSSHIYKFIHHGNPTKLEFSNDDDHRSYEFQINLIGSTSLLPSFSMHDGGVEYKLAVYAALAHDYTNFFYRVADKFLILLGGRLNLALDPLLIEGNTKGPSNDIVKESCTRARANLTVDKKGVLLGETLRCQLRIDNCGDEIIQKMSLEFIQRNIYCANCRNKTVTTLVCQRELLAGYEEKDGGILWEATIRVPGNLMPTFQRKKKSVEILYFVQFNVEVMGKSPLEGETMIVIGTLRDSLGARRGSAAVVTSCPPLPSRPVIVRQGSTSSFYESTDSTSQLVEAEVSTQSQLSTKSSLETDNDHHAWHHWEDESLDPKDAVLDNLECLMTPFAGAMQFIL